MPREAAANKGGNVLFEGLSAVLAITTEGSDSISLISDPRSL
jgi:hypothetical protein